MHGNSVRFPATSERDKRERTHEMGEAQYTQLEAEHTRLCRGRATQTHKGTSYE